MKVVERNEKTLELMIIDIPTVNEGWTENRDKTSRIKLFGVSIIENS